LAKLSRQVGAVPSKNSATDGEDIGVSHHRGTLVSTAIGRELEVSKVRDSGNELTGLSNVTVGEPSIFQRMFKVIESKAVVSSACLGFPDRCRAR